MLPRRVVLVLCVGLSLTAAGPLVLDLNSIFEQDGDASDDPFDAAEDWDTLYAGGANDGGTPIAFTGVVPDHCGLQSCEVAFIFNSRDDMDLPQWTLDHTLVADKHEISDAFAALYRDAGTNHLVAAFGLDRYDSSLDPFVGFWFLQGPVAYDDATPSLTGSHVVGDLLVHAGPMLPAGGPTPFAVFRWVGSGGDAGSGGTLQTVTTTSDVTIQVNTGSASAPWPYVNQATGAGNFPTGSFLEGTADLSTLLGADLPCEFSAFVAETRSSASVTAALRDFVFGTLPTAWSDLGGAVGGSAGPPQLSGTGTLIAGTCLTLDLHDAPASKPAVLFIGLADSPTPFKGGVFHPVPVLLELHLATNPSGEILLSGTFGAGLSGQSLVLQYAITDPTAVKGVALSNGLRADVP